MNVFDGSYVGDATRISEARFALFHLVQRVQDLLRIDRPSNVLTYTVVNRKTKPLLSVELVDVDALVVGQKPTFCAYVQRLEGVLAALEALAIHGCRGNEPAFICAQREREPGSYIAPCVWVLVDPVTLAQREISGEPIYSTEFSW